MDLTFRKWFEDNEDGMFFHGSPMKFDRFDYTYIGQGHDQEGPGFYFTSSQSSATGYANKAGTPGVVYKAALKLDRTVPLQGNPNRADIEWLIKNAPNLNDTLMDWDEDPRVALQQAIRGTLERSTSPHDAFQNVWYDFYRRQGADAQYLKNMVKLGYDGVIIPQQNGVVHAIVFSPDNIRLMAT